MLTVRSTLTRLMPFLFILVGCKTASEVTTNDELKSNNAKKSSFDKDNHSFAVSCKVSLKTGTASNVDKIDVYFAGEDKKFGIGGVNFTVSKGGSEVLSQNCAAGSLRDQLSYYEFSVSPTKGSKITFSADFKMPRVGGPQNSAPAGAPTSVQLYLDNDTYEGNCNEIPLSQQVTCGVGLDRDGMPQICNFAAAGAANDHLADLCEKYKGSKTLCDNNSSLCSIIVSDAIAHSKYSGYKEDGKLVNCPAVTPRVCQTVADPFGDKCTNQGGIAVPDCTWTGRTCKSICTLKVK
ncbi:MAG: hypothetical protein NTV34_15855 [Proteobacteria bacterium]|nr:hypothetical protein [Pseudomonadota bacterium]